MARTFSSLRIRNYRYYFAGQSLSMVGTWMQTVAQTWLVFTLTHSGWQVGVLTAVQTLPILLLGPLGGTIADRFGKYRILFWTQSLAGVQAAVLGVLTLTGTIHVWELYLMAGVLGLVNMVDNPTRQTFIVEMVGRDQLVNAVTLNSVMVNVARAVGPAVAGVLIAVIGPGWCFVVNAVSFVFVVSALRALDPTQLTPAPRAARIRGQLTEGFRYVARRPLLRDALIMMAIVGCLTYEFQVSLPLMAGVAFKGGSATYGFFTATLGVGAVVGGLIAAGRRNRSPMRLVNTLLAFTAVLLAASLAPSPLFELLALLFVGAGMVTFLSLANTTIQLSAAPEMRGRVMSIWSVSFLGTTPIGGPIVGLLGSELGARSSLGVGAVAALAAGLYGLWSFTRPSRKPEIDAFVGQGTGAGAVAAGAGGEGAVGAGSVGAGAVAAGSGGAGAVGAGPGGAGAVAAGPGGAGAGVATAG